VIAPTYVVAVEGLDALRYMDKIPAALERAAVRAVNKTTTRARTAAARAILGQVALPASYLNPAQGRLVVSKKARAGDIEGIVRARTRPTSLARFTKDKPLQPGQERRAKGVRVTVKPGVAKYLSGAFLIPLRSGADGALDNLGLAVRADQKPSGAYKPRLIGKNLWLLYGPAVSQILYSARNKGGVAEDIAPDTAAYLEAEFLRLVNLDLPR